nr:HepT-like ribonuclease domain-containing protein [Microcystis aeruginosa]
MPFRDWQLRLQDIIESIDEILEWTANMTFEDFSSNRVTLKAVLYNLGIIGEALEIFLVRYNCVILKFLGV